MKKIIIVGILMVLTFVISVSGATLYEITADADYTMNGTAGPTAVGDFNGDGYDDFVVGDTSLGDEGGVYIFYGGASKTGMVQAANADIIIYGAQNSEDAGQDVAVGDVNADGFDDIVIGAPLGTALGRLGAGNVYVVFGANITGTLNMSTDANLTLQGGGDSFSTGSVVEVGQIDGAPGADIVVSAVDGEAGGYDDNGVTYVFYGNRTGTYDLNSSANYMIYGVASYDYSGRHLATCDFDNDNFDDILITADWGGGTQGELYEIDGGQSGTFYLGTQADLTLNTPTAVYARTVDCGDVDGDGDDDIMYGARGADPNAMTNAGQIYVFYGGTRTGSYSMPTDADMTINGNHTSGGIGDEVYAGDIDNDGRADIFGGAPWSGKGSIFGLIGDQGTGTYNLYNDADYEIYATGDNLGKHFATGDFDNDGKADLFISGDNSAGGNFGVYIIYGRTQIGEPPIVSSNYNGANLSLVVDFNSVPNFTYCLPGACVTFHNNTNLSNKDLNSTIILGDCFAAVNITGLDYTFNATAYLTLNNSDGHCGGNDIFKSDGFIADADVIRAEDKPCEECYGYNLTNDTLQGFLVSHFSSYAIGGNSRLDIYDTVEGGSAQIGEIITFYANFTNVTSGAHIPGATCNLRFDANTTDYSMIESGNQYVLNGSFPSMGGHTFSVNCSRAGYNTLNATDAFDVDNPVPEFNIWTVGIGLLIVVAGLYYRRKQ